jgi:hypothetical protein
MQDAHARLERGIGTALSNDADDNFGWSGHLQKVIQNFGVFYAIINVYLENP